jgi:hypothetical protein
VNSDSKKDVDQNSGRLHYVCNMNRKRAKAKKRRRRRNDNNLIDKKKTKEKQ